MKKTYLALSKKEQNAIDQWIGEHPQLSPYVLGTTPPAHLELIWEDIYVEEGDVYYAQTYEWVGSERNEYDVMEDIYEPEDWQKVGTLKEMIDSYEE